MNLDYLLNDTKTTKVWCLLKLAKPTCNPMYDTYYRNDSVEITLAEAVRVADAQLPDVVVEYQGEEYTKTWYDKPMPKLSVGKARLWCKQAWIASRQRRSLEQDKIAKRTAKIELVIDYFVQKLERDRQKVRLELLCEMDRTTQQATIDAIYPIAQKALAHK